MEMVVKPGGNQRRNLNGPKMHCSSKGYKAIGGRNEIKTKHKKG
jgi:hypothetical protein